MRVSTGAPEARPVRRRAPLVALLPLLAGCAGGPGDGGPFREGRRPRRGRRTARRRPRPGTRRQRQPSGRLDTSVPARVYDIDGFDHSKATVAALHREGRGVVRHVSAGAWEEFRPHAGRFPASVLKRYEPGVWRRTCWTHGRGPRRTGKGARVRAR